jgi:hypothetical protein
MAQEMTESVEVRLQAQPGSADDLVVTRRFMVFKVIVDDS